MSNDDTTVYYTKQGRRYVPSVLARPWDHNDAMRVGQFRLTYASGQGRRHYEYDVRPDTAGFVAAAMIAKQAMVDAICNATPAKPMGHNVTPYTKRQMKIIERYRAEMADAGGLLPDWWQYARPDDIAQAGIDAVREWGMP